MFRLKSDVGHLGASFSATLADLYVEFSINWSFRYVWIYVCAKEAATFALGSVFLYCPMTYLGK